MKRETCLSNNLLRRFKTSTGGAFAIWAATATPVLVGGAALSVDASRLYNMDQELQSASDALARAGAAELDQRPDSLFRAARAVQNLVRNDQKFADSGASNISVDRIQYLKSIPDQDFQNINPAQFTSNPAEARYLQVNIVPKNISTLFPPSLVSSLTRIKLSANSVAGFEQSVCGVAPVFICNPYEGSDTTLYEALENPWQRRRQLKLITPGGRNSQYGPGNFGYLNAFGGRGGARAIRDAIAIDVSPVCMSKSRGVSLRPGNIASVRHALNTRFDIYEGPFKNKRTDPRYAPAVNVVKGYVSGNDVCESTPSLTAQALPRDACHETQSCVDNNGRFGDGNWDFLEYMKVNHSGWRYIRLDGVNYYIDYQNNRFYPNVAPSRYAMYRWEIDNNCIPGPTTYGRNSGPEEGHPQCHATGASDTVEDRRIIHAAVLNCGALEDAGETLSGRTDAVPVETFVKVFLTEPMGKGQDNILFGELVGTVDGQDSVTRNTVALSR